MSGNQTFVVLTETPAPFAASPPRNIESIKNTDFLGIILSASFLCIIILIILVYSFIQRSQRSREYYDSSIHSQDTINLESIQLSRQESEAEIVDVDVEQARTPLQTSS